MAPRPLKSDFHNEFWTYHFYFDNGMQLILRYSVANFGSVKSPVSGAKVSISNIPGTDKVYDSAKQYPYEFLSYDTASVQLQLKEGKGVWFEGAFDKGHTVRFNTNKDGYSYDIKLQLQDVAPGFVPNSGKRTDLETPANPTKEIQVMVHVPYARVTGHVGIDDKKYEVTGTAYMDHIYLNDRIAKLLKSGMRFVHHQSPDNWVAGYVARSKDIADYPLVGYAIKKSDSLGSKLLFPQDKTVNNKSSVDGRSYPSSFELLFTDSTRYHMEFTEVHQSISVLEDLGRFKKFFVERYLGGEVVNYRGSGQLNGKGTIHFNYFEVK